jgi:hypothetical protein
MAKTDGGSESGVRRRIAATAATAALALSGPAVAARPASARTTSPPRPGSSPITRLANSDQTEAATALEVSRKAEMATHRHLLAGALAAEPGTADAERLERALAQAETRMSSAYSRGERPAFARGLLADLAASAGMSEDELTAAFESMSRRALERTRGQTDS